MDFGAPLIVTMNFVRSARQSARYTVTFPSLLPINAIVDYRGAVSPLSQ